MVTKAKSAVKKAAKTSKYVYLFGNGKADGDGKMKPLLGGKGANLAEMTRIGLPVPPGFTITTDVCTHYYSNGRKYPQALEAQVRTGVEFLEKVAREEIQQPGQAAVGVGPFRRAGFDARA